MPLYFNSLLAMLNTQHYLEDWGGYSLTPRTTFDEAGLPLLESQRNDTLEMGGMDSDIPLIEVKVQQSRLKSENYYREEEEASG
ncbi:hypothetical protein PM082_020012 [Marasmius tenuissimus]|nr:hypothetical protein PM082_020012 [Marasmius tenuissimus]